MTGVFLMVEVSKDRYCAEAFVEAWQYLCLILNLKSIPW
jgi:hypothetical protein